MSTAIDREAKYGAKNYHPLPVVLVKGEGVWLWDENGKKYLDMMSAYSAVSHGHANPRLVRVLSEQAARLAVTSRAFYSEKLGLFLEKLCQMTGLDQALPMNTGAEAVETAIKCTRRYGYFVKKIPDGQAEIIVAAGNFHGRTTTIISFSTEPDYKKGFGPFTPGFVHVPFGDASVIEKAITPRTAGIIIEPIQGEAGIIVPPDGYLKKLREICTKHDILFILDEVQSGLGRTGKMFAYQHESILPDGVILGKALGGGLLPVSAFVARRNVMEVFNPGSHGSTFGGNALASAVAYEALKILEEDKLAEKSAAMGQYLFDRLRGFNSPLIRAVRGRGLWVGVDFDPAKISARKICEVLKEKGVLSKETHETVVRFAPPLTITREELDYGIEQLATTLRELEG